MIPAAIIVDDSPFPLQFDEVLNYQTSDAANLCSIGGYRSDTTIAKGAGYDPATNRIVVSLTNEGDAALQELTATSNEGSSELLATKVSRDTESLIVAVPPAGGPIAAGFQPGDVFAGDMSDKSHWRIRRANAAVAGGAAPIFCAGDVGVLYGGLAFDTDRDGLFGGNLIVLTNQGNLFTVDALGNSKLFVDLQSTFFNDLGFNSGTFEGLAVAPKSFGPYAGQIIFSLENDMGAQDTSPVGGRIYAIDDKKNLSWLADINFAGETLAFVPSTCGTYYQAEKGGTKGRENRLFRVSASQFMARVGHLIAGNEMGGELWDIGWDGVGNRYTQTFVGRLPGTWSSEGFNAQSSELEQGGFSELYPHDWEVTWRKDAVLPRRPVATAPAVLVDADGKTLRIFVTSGKSIWVNSLPVGGVGWGRWARLIPAPGIDIVTTVAPVCVTHHGVPHVFALEDGTGTIKFSQLPPGSPGWLTLPGRGPPKATSLALGATVCDGRIVLALTGSDQLVYMAEMRPGGRNSWDDWFQVPRSPTTKVSPTVVSFQDELYVIVVDVDGDIRVAARSTSGVWTDWSLPPAQAPLTADCPLAATAFTIDGPPFVHTQLHLFVRDSVSKTNDPLQLIASDSGTWNAWNSIILNDPRSTAVAMAAVEFDKSLCLFILDSADGRIYLRQSK